MSTLALIEFYNIPYLYYMYWDGYPEAMVPALLNFLDGKRPLEYVHIFMSKKDMPKTDYTYKISWFNITIEDFCGKIIFNGTRDKLEQWIKEYK